MSVVHDDVYPRSPPFANACEHFTPIGKGILVIIATIACNNYLPKAMFLAQTARAHHPDATIILGLVEKSIHDHALGCGLFDRVVLAADLYEDDFEPFVFTHDVIEASTAIKPRLLRWAFSEYPDERLVVYLDPDIWVFDRLNELFDEGLFDIAVTPHQLRDEPTAGAGPRQRTSHVAMRSFQSGLLGS